MTQYYTGTSSYLPSSYKDDKKPTDQQNNNDQQPQAQSTPTTTHQINISQILVDFKNTIASIGAPADVEAKVHEYIAMVEDESNKETPRKETIITSLKTASRLLDDYISNTLKKPSSVVQDWIDAFLLQQVDYKADSKKAEIPASKQIEAQLDPNEKQRLESASSVASYNNYNHYQNQINSKKQYAQAANTNTQTTNHVSSQASQDATKEVANTQVEIQPQEKPKKKLKFAAPDGKIYQGNQVIGEKTQDGQAKIYAAEEAAKISMETKEDYQEPIEEQKPLPTSQKATSYKSQTQSVVDKNNGGISVNSMIQGFYEKAKKYLESGDTQKALESYKKTLKYAKQYNDRQSQAYIIQGIGESYDELNNIARAAKCFNRVTKISKDTSLKATGHNSLGGVYDEAGKYELAMDHYFESLALNGETDDTASQAKTLNNIGKMQTSRYMSKEAIDFFKLALELAKQKDPDVAVMGNVLSNTADAFKMINKPQSALKYYQKSITCATKANDKETASQTYEKAGDLMLDMGKTLKAQSLYKKAMQEALNSKDTQQVRTLREKMASLS